MRIAGGILVPLDTTLLQTYTHENMMGKVFSFHYSVYGSLIQLSMFFTGGLLEILSPQIIGSLLATCCIFVNFIWLFLFIAGISVNNLMIINRLFTEIPFIICFPIIKLLKNVSLTF